MRLFRLIALTFINLVFSFAGSFLLTWPLTTKLNTPNFTTSLIIATLVSLSLDYSLFLLSEVKKHLRLGRTMHMSVEEGLRTAGHTILVSGATLAACFLVLAIFPISIVRAPGIATTFAVAMSVATNLTLSPTLLLSFPTFWAGGTGAVQKDGGNHGGVVASTTTTTTRDHIYAWTAVRRKCSPFVQWASSMDVWPTVARVTKEYKYTVASVITVLCVAPFAHRLEHFTTSQVRTFHCTPIATRLGSGRNAADEDVSLYLRIYETLCRAICPPSPPCSRCKTRLDQVLWRA